RLSDAEVLYFDPSITYIAPLKDKKAKEKVKAYKQSGEKVQENITVYSLPPILPFFAKFRWINRINQKKIAKFVTKKMEEHGFQNPVLWTYNPISADAVDYIPHSGLVYDCVDRHSAYGGLMNPDLVDTMELDLARGADMVFATALGLCERLQTVNPKANFIPNGANYPRFSQAAQPQPCPVELQTLDKPILGFVGALQECIAYDYLEYAAQNRPDWNFVFIGRKSVGVDLSKLESLPNCHFLGLKPNEDLPKYMAQFDVCLNLFATSDLSKDVSPLKFYEYLATGKPIVSTRQPDQVLDFAHIIQIAGSKEEFVTQCEVAITDVLPEHTEARLDAGKASSWDSRVEQMEEILRNEGIFK
ncbi:MAG: glycosyltransferase, partial [Eubacteriales bacterium]